MVYEFIEGGAEDEYSLTANRRAWEAITFRPRVLVDVGKIAHSVSVAGQELDIPIILAPTGCPGSPGRTGSTPPRRQLMHTAPSQW